jgi:hypothetical protein
MKCNECNRRVKDTPEAKMKHIAKYHPVHVIQKLINPESAFQLGSLFGTMVRERIVRRET